MLPGPDEIIGCPSCRKPLATGTILSGNTFGAAQWSDGKYEAPMLPEPIRVASCGHCQGVFWVEDAEWMGEVPNGIFDHSAERNPVPDAWREAPRLRPADLEELQSVWGATEDRQRRCFLSVKIWHLLNDVVRQEGVLPETQAAAFRTNLEDLLLLLDEASSAERVMKAEVLRELGRQDEALALLAGAPEALEWVASQIRALARAGHTAVTRLGTD